MSIKTWQERYERMDPNQKQCHSGESLAQAKAKDAEIADHRAAQHSVTEHASGNGWMAMPIEPGMYWRCDTVNGAEYPPSIIEVVVSPGGPLATVAHGAQLGFGFTGDKFYPIDANDTRWLKIDQPMPPTDRNEPIAFSCKKRATAGAAAWSQTCESHCGDNAGCPAGRAQTLASTAATQPEQALTAAVDAAMVEMANISPPLRRSDCARLIRAALAIPESTAASEYPKFQHPDNGAVDRFADAMKKKMAASRAKGRNGWDNEVLCPADRLRTMLVDHLAKGDPVDIGNFAMMLWNRGERTAASEQQASVSEASDFDQIAVRAAADTGVFCTMPQAVAFGHAIRAALSGRATIPSDVKPIIDVWVDPHTMQRSLLDHGTPLAPFDKREFVGSLVWSTDPQDDPVNADNLKLRAVLDVQASTAASEQQASVSEAACALHDICKEFGWRTDGDAFMLTDRLMHHIREMKASIKARDAALSGRATIPSEADERAADGETIDQKAENALLWCYRRLKNSYGRLPFVEEAVAGLRARAATPDTATTAADQQGDTASASDDDIKAIAINYAHFVAGDVYDVTKYDCAEDFFNCVRACIESLSTRAPAPSHLAQQGAAQAQAGDMVRDLVKLWDAQSASADDYNDAMCGIEGRMRTFAATGDVPQSVERHGDQSVIVTFRSCRAASAFLAKNKH